MKNQSPCLLLPLLIFFFFFSCSSNAYDNDGLFGAQVIPKEGRNVIAFTESGIITATDVRDGRRGSYHLQFIKMEPDSLFLPVLLHSDMVFYVHTGKGRLSYVTSGEDANSKELKRGDIYRLEQGSVFYIRSHADPLGEKLRIHAIFDTISEPDNLPENFVGAYSNISDLVLGFDERVLEMGFGVSEEVIHVVKSAKKIPPMVPYAQRNETKESEEEEDELLESILGIKRPFDFLNKKKKKDKSKKSKAFNVFEENPDVKNCNGWSISVNNKDNKVLKGSDLGFFMVNLTKGSMMGPHWNPVATEIAIVVDGEGMVQVLCPSNPAGSDVRPCKNSRFRVKKGDVFVVPRYHPMAQMSFNNDSLVFVGFSTRAAYNHPQFLAGSKTALQVIDKEILAIAFNTDNTTLDELLSAQKQAVILECTSCAEEAAIKMDEETERERQDEEERKREEEARKREDEEARKREEEEKRKQEEEARRREQEEEERRQEEEESRRKEQEERRRQEEEQRRQEEEEARRREEEQRGQEEEEEGERRRGEGEEEEERGRGEEEERQRRQGEDDPDIGQAYFKGNERKVQ